MTRQLGSLVSEVSATVDGLVSRDVQFTGCADEPKLLTRLLEFRNSTGEWGHTTTFNTNISHVAVRGSGTGIDREECLLPAFAELLERYSSSVYTDYQIIWATANELGSEAIDIDCIPVCSPTELSHPRCPLVAPQKNQPIRWVKGLSLSNKRLVYLPAVMVYLYAGYASNAERIAVPISTGCAAHVTYEQAIVNAILETVERDALSLVWLQKLPLPRLRIEELHSPWEKVWDAYCSSSKNLDYRFFNATSDIGIPTIYGLRIAPNSTSAHTLVACATSLSPQEAVAKVIRDFSAACVSFRSVRRIPSNWDDFTAVHHGAVFMAHASRNEAFDFLTEQQESQMLMDVPLLAQFAPDRFDTLRKLLAHLRAKNLDVFVVDLTTDEAFRSGLKVVRVVIPQLQPLPYRYLARYLGNARLYEAPLNMGYTVRHESQLNRWPNPFA